MKKLFFKISTLVIFFILSIANITIINSFAFPNIYSEGVTISENPPKADGSSIGIEQGEVYTIEELLIGLLLESGNDCAEAIAEHIAGSNEEFAKLMNKEAKSIGISTLSSGSSVSSFTTGTSSFFAISFAASWDFLAFRAEP